MDHETGAPADVVFDVGHVSEGEDDDGGVDRRHTDGQPHGNDGGEAKDGDNWVDLETGAVVVRHVGRGHGDDQNDCHE